jgi:hypothetical protein
LGGLGPPPPHPKGTHPKKKKIKKKKKYNFYSFFKKFVVLTPQIIFFQFSPQSLKAGSPDGGVRAKDNEEGYHLFSLEY